MAIAVKLRSHREAIEALKEKGYTVQPVRFGSGDHLIVDVQRTEGRRGRITISGSPRGSCLHSILSCAKRATA